MNKSILETEKQIRFLYESGVISTKFLKRIESIIALAKQADKASRILNKTLTKEQKVLQESHIRKTLELQVIQ